MLTHFEEELNKLRKNINEMANLVDSQIKNANKALIELDPGLCKVVKSRDKEIDAYDTLIQAQTENLLALFQPVAFDLRYVIATMMANTQLERCGDIAVNIVQRVKKVIDFGDIIKDFEIIKMAQVASDMAHNAIEAFLNSDVNLANKVFKKDDIVDNYNKTIFKQLVEKMKQDQNLIEICSHLIVLIRHIERLGDHATNIAEDVVFLINSQIVAHQEH